MQDINARIGLNNRFRSHREHMSVMLVENGDLSAASGLAIDPQVTPCPSRPAGTNDCKGIDINCSSGYAFTYPQHDRNNTFAQDSNTAICHK